MPYDKPSGSEAVAIFQNLFGGRDPKANKLFLVWSIEAEKHM